MKQAPCRGVGEGARFQGAAGCDTAKELRSARLFRPVPWRLSMRFSSRRRSIDRLDRSQIELLFSVSRKTLQTLKPAVWAQGTRKTCPKAMPGSRLSAKNQAKNPVSAVIASGIVGFPST